jgi:hypothetical protein
MKQIAAINRINFFIFYIFKYLFEQSCVPYISNRYIFLQDSFIFHIYCKVRLSSLPT